MHVAINNLAGGREPGSGCEGYEEGGHWPCFYALCTCLRFPEEINIIQNSAKEANMRRYLKAKSFRQLHSHRGPSPSTHNF